MRSSVWCVACVFALAAHPKSASADELPPNEVKSQSLEEAAVGSCKKIGFDEGTTDNRECVREVIELSAMKYPGKPIVVALGVNLGEICAKYYPSESRRAHEEGRTQFLFYVAANGRIAEGLVEVSSGHHLLDVAAANCLIKDPRSHYVPASINGKPIGAWFRLAWTYRLAS